MNLRHLLILCVLLTFAVAAPLLFITPGHSSLSGRISDFEKRSDIEERIKRVISEQLGIPIAEIKNESSFINDLEADELDATELIMALEKEFDYEISDAQAEKITTVQQSIENVRANGRR